MKITVLIGIAVIAMLVVTKAAVAADYQIGLKVWANTGQRNDSSADGRLADLR